MPSVEILFEDDDILIVNKPAGMIVHPAPGHSDGTLMDALLAHIESVLAKAAADTCYSESFSGADVPDAEAKVKELVDGIERGVFWPAADTSEWRWDFADWIFNSPEESVDPAWIADQLRRIEVGART